MRGAGAADAGRRLAGQAPGGDARGARRRAPRRSAPASLDPYFSAGKLAWLLRHDDAVAAARRRGTLRMGTVDAYLSERLGAGFATDVSTASRTQLLALGGPTGTAAAGRFGVPRESCRASARLRRARRPAPRAWPQEVPLTARACDQQAALAGSGASSRAGQGDLRDGRLRARTRRAPGPRVRRACCRRSPGPPVRGRPASSPTRSTAACSRPGRCSSGWPAGSASRRTCPR